MTPMQAAAANQTSMRAIFALRRYVHPPVERCELCRASLPARHGHLLDRKAATLRCACPGCAGRHGRPEDGFLAVPPRKEKLKDFILSDAGWNQFQIPIDLAFLVRKESGLVALYPGPAGIVQSETSPQAWNDLAAQNPVLDSLAPEVEALAINRVHGRRDAWRLSIDHCFTLAGTLRKDWHGLSGGPKVWEAIEHYFDERDFGGHDHA
jgi:hypothetical protein